MGRRSNYAQQQNPQNPSIKQMLYLPEEIILDIQAEGKRQERSTAWLLRKAWGLARLKLQSYPSAEDLLK